MTETEEACLGFVLDSEQTKKIMELCEYMGSQPHKLIVDSINRLWDAYTKQVLSKHE